MRNKGFTLAEVLITLGIIGVVAALTIPSLLSTYKKRVTATKLKQTYSILSTALNTSETEIGTPFCYKYATDKYSQDLYRQVNVLFQDFIKPHVSTNVKEINHAQCWGNSNCPEIKQDLAVTQFGKYATFPNGTTIVIYNGEIFVITDPLSFNSKKPLKLVAGKNFFGLGPAVGMCNDLICINTIPHILTPFHQVNLPGWWFQSSRYRGKYTDTQMRENCTKTSSELPTRAAFCTQIYLENNFTFPKDYPVQF